MKSSNQNNKNLSRASLRDQVGILGFTILLVPILVSFPLSAKLDHGLEDFVFHTINVSSARADDGLVFVSIDDNSVDPDHVDVNNHNLPSQNASIWNRDGWQTRRLWNQCLSDMGQLYKPRLICFDIIFPESTPPNSQQSDDEAKLHEIEHSGDLEFQSRLFDFDDNRNDGQYAPQTLFAYEFPDDKVTEAHLLSYELDKQTDWFKRLTPFVLPDGCVEAGTLGRVYRSIRLPMNEILKAPSFNLGAINAQPDDDSVFRRAPLLFAFQSSPTAPVRYTPSFALEAYLLYQGINVKDIHLPGQGVPSLHAVPGQSLTLVTTKGTLIIPIDRQLRLAFAPRFTFPKQITQRPFVQLLDNATNYPNDHTPGLEDQKIIQDKIVMVGVGFTLGPDHGNFALQPEMPRTLLHLHVLNNLLQADFLREHGFRSLIVLSYIMIAAICLVHFLFSSRLAIGIHIALGIIFPLIAVWSLVFGNVVLPFFVPEVVIVASLGLHMYSHSVQARRDRELMRQLFATVTSHRVLQLLEENPDAYYRSRKQQATILFSDVEGFTSLSEKLDPDFLRDLINRYLTPMTDIIIKYDGYVDKYAGDGIMALWGAPLVDPNHALQACRAAWYQLRAASDLNVTLPDGTHYKFRIRIGLNSGFVAAGNMGSTQKQQYTVMGDEVNLAARLEPTNKDYQTSIIIGPLTYEQAAAGIVARKLDIIVVKGRKAAVVIYELLGLNEECPDIPEWARLYEIGLQLAWQRDWDRAEALFQQANQFRAGGDTPSRVQLERIAQYRENPPPPEWQGEHIRQTKD